MFRIKRRTRFSPFKGETERGMARRSAGCTERRMIKRVLLLFSITVFFAGCGAITARDPEGPDARIERRDGSIAGSGAAPADGKGTEQKKDVK